MLKTPEFKQSATTQAVYELFVKASNNEPFLVTWLDLTQATHKNRAELRGPLRTVRRRMVADHGVVFENEANLGYRVVDNPGLSEVGQRAIERSRNQQRWGLKQMGCVEMEKLTPDQRVRHITRSQVLELGLASSRARTVKNVEQSVMRKHNQLTPDEQIEAIKDALRPK